MYGQALCTPMNGQCRSAAGTGFLCTRDRVAGQACHLPGIAVWCGVLLFCLAQTAAASASTEPGSALTDRAGDAGANAPEFVDILSARARRVNARFLQFEITLAGAIRLDAALNNAHRYMWLLDTDGNPLTGQKHAHTGSEYNLRVFRDGDGEWTGTLDGPESLRYVKVFLGGRHVRALVHLADLRWPKAIRWECSATLGPRWHDASDTGATLDLVGGVTVQPPVGHITVLPEYVTLVAGRTQAAGQVVVQDDSLAVHALGNTRVDVFCTRPGIVRFDTTDGGRFTMRAVPGAFGSGRVTACVDGIVCSRDAQVNVGRFLPANPLLYATLRSPEPPRIACRIEGADGHAVEPPERIAFRSRQPGDLSVAGDGTITVQAGAERRRVAVEIRAGGRGAAAALCFVRTWHKPYALEDWRAFESGAAQFWVPAGLATDREGESIGRMMRRFGVAPMADAVHSYLTSRLGTCAFGGDCQVFVVDCAEDDAPDRPSGVNGNPILLGLNLDQPSPQNCIQLQNGAPHFGVALHELGHNFWGACPRHRETLFMPDLGQDTIRYNEGLATHLAQIGQWYLLAQQRSPRVPAPMRDYVRGDQYYGSLAFNRRVFGQALEKYERAKPGYAGCDPNVVDGILIWLGDTYGWEHYERWLACYYPQYPLPVQTSTSEKRATFQVAALSAAFDRDLRHLFAERWRFPIDEPYYQAVLPDLEHAVAYAGSLQQIGDALRQANRQQAAEGPR